MIYLDNAATTKVYNEVIHLINYYNTELYFNPSAMYRSAASVRQAITEAREGLAAILRVKPNELIFTGSASEANNMAIRSAARMGGKAIIACESEHPSVSSTLLDLKAKGYNIRLTSANSFAGVDEDALLSAVDDDTALVCIMHVNNETGYINDVKALTQKIKAKNPRCKVHADGVQAFCKLETSPASLGVDSYAISGHKIHAPKGVGALYVRGGNFPNAFITGGEQEGGRRAGTENVSGIAAFCESARITSANMSANTAKFQVIKALMTDIILQGLGEVRINSPMDSSVPNILNISINGIRSEVLLHTLEDDGILIGLGSACSSRSKAGRIAEAMKLPKEYAEGTMRLSFSHETTSADAEYAACKIVKNAKKLRKILGR